MTVATVVTTVGWLGNVCFFSRFFYQWLVSEKAGRSVAPTGFWWLSLGGSSLLLVYSFDRGEPILLFGYVLTSFIYARNLWIAKSRQSAGRINPIPALLLASCSWALLTAVSVHKIPPQFGQSPLWLLAAIVGQSVWSSRFLVQWLATEKKGDSHFPVSFWWLSLAGNTLLLSYAFHLRDPVWIAGLLLGPLVQIRNLVLHQRSRTLGTTGAPGTREDDDGQSRVTTPPGATS